MKTRSLLACLGAVGTLATIAVAAPDKATFNENLVGPWRLFFDDHGLVSKTNLVRQYHPFQKQGKEPIIVVDQPWEENCINVTAVIPDEAGTGLRMYYYCWSKKGSSERTYSCYAESKDGLKWYKPGIGLSEYKDPDTGKVYKDTNIMPISPGSVMRTPWEKDPQKKFQGVGDMYHAFSSPDGIHWKQESKEVIVHGGDTSYFYWDPNVKKYRANVKGGATDKVSSDVVGLSRRVVGFSESDTLMHFDPLRIIMAPDDQDDAWVKPGTVQRTHFYACPVAPYETGYIGLLQIYRAEEQWGYFHGPLWLELVTSRDGIHWNRQEGDRTPILGLGKFRSFDDGMVIAPPPLLKGDELWLFYAGYDELHDLLPYKAAIGLAKMRKDGFVSINSEDGAGEMTTKCYEGVGGPLMVNYSARKGSLRVEVLDQKGQVIPGYGRDDCEALQGDAVRGTITWKNQKELPADRGPVRFRFLLDRARIYSFMPGEKAKLIDEQLKPPLQALFTFEGKTNPWSDALPADGLQVLKNYGTSYMDDAKAPAGAPVKPSHAFGERALIVDSVFRPWNRMEITGTSDLGTHFTLAAMVHPTRNKLARLFSSYRGNFPVSTSEMVFDFDPAGRMHSGLRFICKGIVAESDNVKFDDNKYHHLAVTYDDGCVSFYLDGKRVGRQWIPGGDPVKFPRNLTVAEDAERGETDRQLRGYLDDILVLGKALSDEEIAQVAKEGAGAFFKVSQ